MSLFGGIGKSLSSFSSSFKRNLGKISKGLVKSGLKTVETAVSGTAKLAQGDISGALDKYGRTITNLESFYSGGMLDLTGRNKGVINVNSSAYANAILGKTPKEETASGLTGISKQREVLRGGKKVGGGSETAKAKYPLGGVSGLVGK